MTTFVTQSEELIICDLSCVNPVQQFCNSCQVGLCGDCINKHVDSLKSIKHDIVPFIKRTIELVFSQCTSHPNQRSEAHCKQCDVPVCIKCVVGPRHKGHDIEDMADIVAKKKEKIKKETEEMEKIISKNIECDANAEEKLSKSLTYNSDLAKQAEDQRKIWHLEVDNIFDIFDSLIQSIQDEEIKILKSYQSELRSQNSLMNQTVHENKDILKSNNASDVNDHKSKLNRGVIEVPDIKQLPLITKADQGKQLCIEFREYKATMTLTTLPRLRDAKEIANIPTNLTKLAKVACIKSGKAWISGKDEKIQCVDIHGTVQDTVTSTCFDFPTDIAVNKQGELIYSDYINRTVNIIRHNPMITIPQGWHPMGLCCTRSDDILVSTKTTDNCHCKIVLYQGQSVIQEINQDEHGNPIYQGGSYEVFVTENNNGDIVASDLNAKAVVVVDRTGKVRFRYNDKPPTGQEPFSPRQIATDSMGHIIVADPDNACLHILDQNGQFIKCVDDCGLNEWPTGLSVDSEGRLWVGSYNSGELKVIQYI
ncbi:uncharacterized protein LOC125656567 [Ostrea edulis]|uniref:uncharacterized protein LOC125656567 n=1 Tax=Ostrea edulis TaxID=37623 RepID=UPI0024AFEBB1|nr:uncharacterized protein LOC125656567 [Ostrea edulis]XP_055999942.1 uncharacterized protein LOC125656567 [Ostrea edulis]